LSQGGAKPPSSPINVASPPNLALIIFPKVWYTSHPICMASANVLAPVKVDEEVEVVKADHPVIVDSPKNEIVEYSKEFAWKKQIKNYYIPAVKQVIQKSNG
jgi:hypothetical protein